MMYTNPKYSNPEHTTIQVDINHITSFVPCVPGNSDYSRIQELVTNSELVIQPYTPPSAPPITQVTMRQARLVLLNNDLLDAVEATIANMSKQSQIEWEYSTIVDRSSELVQDISQSLSLSAEQIDQLFHEASQL